jgi:1,2-diacylglycerol 3-alpha-glucosyltransferase
VNIAIFSDSYLPVLNGVSIAIRSLIGELRRDHRVYVFAPRFPGHKDEDPDVVRLRATMTPFARGYPLAHPPFGRSRRRFLDLPIDLVHTHTPFTVGLCGLRWAKAPGTPVVSTYHTLYEHYAHYAKLVPRALVRRHIARRTTSYYNRVAHVITPSNVARESLLSHSVTTPITVIPTGIPQPPPVSKADARRQLGIPEDEFALVYAGRLAPEKNLSLLIEAMSVWRERIPRVRLHLVGGGPGRKALEEASKPHRGYIVFHGMVPREEVPTYLAAGDLFVFPSVTETQGLVIGEAQTVGLPAVAVDGGGAPEAITEGVDGFVVANDPAAFAAKVVDLAAAPALLAEVGRAAKETSLRWTPAHTVEQVLGVYSEVLAAGGGGRVAVGARKN